MKDFLLKHFFSILILVGTCYLVGPTLFTLESSLIERTGKVEVIKTNYIPVQSRGISSIKAELYIKLENEEARYVVSENVRSSNYYAPYEEIVRKVKHSGVANIWIKKSHQTKLDPIVFKITNRDKTILYSIKEAKYKAKIILLAGLAIAFIFLFVKDEYERTNDKQNKKDKYESENVYHTLFFRMTGFLLTIFFGLLAYSFFQVNHQIDIAVILLILTTVLFAFGTLRFYSLTTRNKSVKKKNYNND